MPKIASEKQAGFLRDRLVLVSIVVTLITNILLWLLTIGKFSFSEELLPLHFSVVYGIDFVGSSKQIYELPAAALLILAINFGLAKIIYQEARLFSYFLSVAAALTQIVFLVAVILLVILNA